MDTSQFGKGALRDTYDIRDYHYAPRGMFDWEKGFDIEEKIGAKLVVKDQNGSGSCGGQAFSYYGEVLEALATGTYEPRSARWPYSHAYAPGGGSNGRPLSDFLIKNGWALEKDATSYENGKPPSESFMETIPTLSNDGVSVAEISRPASYLQVKGDFETIAQAMQDHNGVCVALYGEDNGTWHSKFPQPPTNQVWGHWLYFCKAKMINGKKMLGFINSWGKDIGDNGWQWIGEDYFVNGNVWYGWTLAWDYQPAKHKLALQAMVKALIQLVSLYKQLINKK